MGLPSQRPQTPFEKIVSAIARVPKAEVDAEESKRDSGRFKPGPKPKKPVA